VAINGIYSLQVEFDWQEGATSLLATIYTTKQCKAEMGFNYPITLEVITFSRISSQNQSRLFFCLLPSVKYGKFLVLVPYFSFPSVVLVL